MSRRFWNYGNDVMMMLESCSGNYQIFINLPDILLIELSGLLWPTESASWEK